MKSSGRIPAHVRLPSSQFYWAELDTSILPGVRRRRPTEMNLQFLFENVVPVSVEEMAVAFARLGQTRWIACGIELVRLRQLTGMETVTVTPDEIPSFLRDGSNLGPRSLNVLRGRNIPAAVRRVRNRVKWIAVLGMLLCAVAIIVGLERRTAYAKQRAIQVAQLRAQIAQDAVGGDVGMQRPELALLGVLRQLQASGGVANQACAADGLAQLIGSWPGTLSSRDQRPSLISITHERAQIRARLRTMAEANRFAAAFESDERMQRFWHADPTSVHSSTDGFFDVTVALDRARSGGVSP